MQQTVFPPSAFSPWAALLNSHLSRRDCMKNLLLIVTLLFSLVCVGCGPKGNTVVTPSDTELTAEEAQAQEEDDQKREEYESGGDRE